MRGPVSILQMGLFLWLVVTLQLKIQLRVYAEGIQPIFHLYKLVVISIFFIGLPAVRTHHFQQSQNNDVYVCNRTGSVCISKLWYSAMLT